MGEIESIKTLGIAGITLVALVAIVLVGIAIVEQYGYTLRDTTIVRSNETQLTTMSNDSEVRVGATGTYPYLQDLTGCFNGTNKSLTLTLDTDYSIVEGDSDGGWIQLITVDYNGSDINCSYLEYLATSTGSTSANVFIAGLALFGTFSGILVLAIIGKAIIALFKQK